MKPALKTASLLSVSMALPAIALAQEGSSNAAASPTLETVVVTAQKREENLQNVPISVSVVKADELAARGVRSAMDLQTAVPGLVYNNIAGIPLVFLRGIGTDIAIPNSEPSVATYVDGAVVASTANGILNLLGVDRVEVVAGPQGTLYGRNAVGGAINIVTLTPKQDLEANATVGIGNFSRREITARISGGVTDTLALGLYAASTERDTYFERVGPRPLGEHGYEHELGKMKQWGARIKAVYEPSDWLKLTASVEKTNEKGPEGIGFRETQPNAVAFAFGAPLLIEPFKLSGEQPDFSVIDQKAATLREEMDFGWARLLGISNYREAWNATGMDYDATALPVIMSAAVTKDRQWSQELQLLSPADSSWQWLAGLYYFDSKGGYNPLYSRSELLFPAPVTETQLVANVHAQSAAAFAQITVPLWADGLKLTLGGRYTMDKKIYQGGADSALDPSNATLATTFYPRLSKDWNEFTPKLALDYQLGDTLLYFSYGRGFKAGAYNMTLPSAIGPVDPERLDAYEIGTKSELFDNRVRFNTAAYYYKFEDRQAQIQQPGAVLLLNAANAKAYGLELNALAAVSSQLTLNAAIAYEQTEYTSFPNLAGFTSGLVGNTPAVIDAKGNDLQRAPDWTISAGAKYTIPFSSGATFTADLGWYYNGGYYWDASNSERQQAYDVFNGALSYTSADRRWTTSLSGTNLTDTHYYYISNTSALGTLVIDAAPRMYGVSLSYSW